MARKRILYSSKLVKLGTNVLKGVQSCTYGFEFARTDINAFGKLSVYDRLLTSTPTVNTEIQAYAGANGQLISRTQLLSNVSDPLLDTSIGLAGNDTDSDYAGNGSIIKTEGNFIVAASIEAAVASFPLHNVGFEGTGMTVSNDNVGSVPTGCEARTQEHVTVGFNDSADGSLYNASGTAQSANMTVNITRELLEKFGQRYANERLIQFPASATITLEGLDTANAIDYNTLSSYSQKGSASSMASSNMLKNVDFKLNMSVGEGVAPVYVNYGLSGCIADSVTFNGGIGDNHTLSMVLTSPIGSTGDTIHNFMWHAPMT